MRFKYPGTEKLILDGVSFTIERGKHYSFVGENGAGKTTITKLITGLYTNYEGEILVDEKSLRELSHSQIKSLVSVVYQDFAKYYISLYDNIAIGNLNRPGTKEEIKKAIDFLELTELADKLKSGLDTTLGKIAENGVDISGGEWQRTAIARSIVSKAPLKILDEPTAALDPINESMMYRNFEKVSRKNNGGTTIYISHRLGSTKFADVIYVLSGGRIVEEGSHKILLACGGLYAEMYESQAGWYNSPEGEFLNG